MNPLALFGAIGLSFSLTGCVVYEQSHAHESRDRDRYEERDYQPDVRITWGVGNYYYDPYLNLYVSYGFPSSYWLDGFYFRYSGDSWMRAAHWHGPWVTVGPRFLPRRIQTFRHDYARYPKRYPNNIRLDSYREDRSHNHAANERAHSSEARRNRSDENSQHDDHRYRSEDRSSHSEHQRHTEDKRQEKHQRRDHSAKQKKTQKKSSTERRNPRETSNEAIRAKD